MSLNRFAISALSKHNKAEAINEEILVDKATGEFLIKGLNGEFISFNRLSRLQSHINSIKNTCLTQNFYGKVYGIELEDVDLPKVIDEDVEIISSPQLLSPNQLDSLLLSIDVDAIFGIGDTNKGNVHMNEPKINMTILLATNETTTDTYGLTLEYNKSELGLKIIKPEYPTWNPGDVINYSSYITSMTISRNILDIPATDLRMILYGILYVIKEVS